jgi:archaeal preflagellin peptidase FlaK
MFEVSSTTLFALRVVVLLGGLGFAAYQDWEIREVGDGLWQGMGVLGVAFGIVAFWGNLLALGLWLLVGLWALEHLFAWDAPFERYSKRLPGWIEITIYLAVIAAVVYSAVEYGVSSSGVPIAIVAVAASILLARGLFEIGVLYGGADAKALMMAGLLLPVDAAPLWSPPVAAALLGYYPFSLTVLIDAALFAAAVPIAIAIRNLSAHEFVFPRGFTGYTIPVAELPDRYVWIKDPTFTNPGTEDEPEPQTTEEDRALRRRQAEELMKQGVQRVWVTPQLPFILWILAGTVAALLAGNLVFDLITAL